MILTIAVATAVVLWPMCMIWAAWSEEDFGWLDVLGALGLAVLITPLALLAMAWVAIIWNA